MGYLFLWIPLKVPATGVMGYLRCSLSPLQSLSTTEMFLRSLGSELGGREGVN